MTAIRAARPHRPPHLVTMSTSSESRMCLTVGVRRWTGRWTAAAARQETFDAPFDRPVARTRVAALLFPDANDPLAAVRWNLHELRRLLGPDSDVAGDPITTRLAPNTALDVTSLRSGSW